MVASGLEAVLVKVASQGLLPYKHLGKSIAELTPVFQVRTTYMSWCMYGRLDVDGTD